MDIWHVENKEWTRLRLWRISEGSFRVTEAGTYEPLLTNATYTLIQEKYSSAFTSLNNLIIVTPVKIQDYLTKTENDNYCELKVQNHINPDTINTIVSAGRMVWTYNGELFVSGELKKELHKIDKEGIVFNLGFSMFGG
jgi:hypothetical protein